MAINNLNDGVGKKIVDALKMQSDDNDNETDIEMDDRSEDIVINEVDDTNDDVEEDSSFTQSDIDTEFNKSLSQNLGSSFVNNTGLDGVEFPANVAVLRQLISKLPAGVSKQTGAVIIKQTMEALGISVADQEKYSAML